MSTQTTNYGLIKPQLTDAPDITAMNVNWETIDTELYGKQNKIITFGDLSSDVNVVNAAEEGV